MAVLSSSTITAAGTVISGTLTHLHNKTAIGLGAVFTYGSGGTNAKAYVQSSFDDGTTWFDVAQFAVTTSSVNKGVTMGWPVLGTAHFALTDGSLADNTVSGAPIGSMARVKLISTGTYAGTTTMVVNIDFKTS